MGLASSSGSSRTTDHTKDGGWWGMYVLLPLVEKAADEVVRIQDARMASPGDALYMMESFRQVFAGVFGDTEEAEGESAERPTMRERDAEVLLKFLERDRGVLVVDKEVRSHFYHSPRRGNVLMRHIFSILGDQVCGQERSTGRTNDYRCRQGDSGTEERHSQPATAGRPRAAQD